MCTDAVVVKKGERIWCDTVGDLAATLGVAPSVVSDDPPENCLCNANWEAIGARRATDAEGWPFPEYVIELPRAPAG